MMNEISDLLSFYVKFSQDEQMYNDNDNDINDVSLFWYLQTYVCMCLVEVKLEFNAMK